MMNRIHFLICWGLLISGSAGTLFAQQEFTLKEKRIKGADDPLVYPVARWIAAETKTPQELKASPKNLDRRSACFLLPIGGQKLVALLDEKGNDKLYVDTDGDGDLSNEKPLKSARSGGSGWLFEVNDNLYGPVSVRLSVDGPAIELFVRMYQGKHAMVFPALYMDGTIKLEGKSYRFALLDRNLDGRYDGKLTLPRKREDQENRSDLVAIDLDQDGEFNVNYEQSQEIQPLAQFLPVKGVYYTLNVEPSGAVIRLVKANPKMGILDLGNDNIEMLLISENGLHRLEHGKSKWALPIGRYSAYLVTLRKKDDQKNDWTLQCYGNTGKLDDIQITDEQITTINVGTPVQLSASANKRKSWFRSYLEIEPVIIGQAGETYGASARKVNQRPPAPKFKILDEKSKVLASGQFEYG